MSTTVNYVLAMEKSLRERLSQLNDLKSQSARKTHFLETDKMEEPTYDIRKVDAKITEINRALFEINHKVKESNAKTTLELSVDYNQLMAELT